MSEEREKRTHKIGDVCRMAALQPYVLRYWETEFPALAPSKSGGGQRMYSQREIDIILRIKQLLYSEGFTIAGAKKKLESELDENHQLTVPVEAPSSPARRAGAETPAPEGQMSEELEEVLQDTKRELRRIVELLSK